MDSFCNAVWSTNIVIFARGGFFVIVDSSLSHGPLLATLWTVAYQDSSVHGISLGLFKIWASYNIF